jgi:hypothetical protein
MSIGSLNTFLTDYICSLYERTRSEKKGLKIGFDWIIYKLASTRDWIPIRLPFYRDIAGEISKPKTEAEFGIDLSFLLPSGEELYIFVLKDEPLTYKNWTQYNFDKDLRMAATPDLTYPELSKVKEVKVILAFNKDEDQNGIKAFTDLIHTFQSKINNNVSMTFERWNLTKLVEEIKKDLITPDLLPQHLSEHFRYICLQIKDFDFGTEQWENQLVTNWKSFLNVLLSDPDERKIRLVPVVLGIANNQRKDTPNSYPGWIDLLEWAMLFLWKCYKDTNNQSFRQIIIQIWIQFYVFELEIYLTQVNQVFLTQHAFSNFSGAPNYGVSIINDAYMAFWHLGRLGILTLAPQEIQPRTEKYLDQAINRSADWLVNCFRQNPASLRPILDLNHIELFLAWLIMWQARREDDIYEWLSELEQRLLVRRINERNTCPFIESQNNMDLVVEYATKGERPEGYSDSSSYLLQMLLELICSLTNDKRDDLLKRYHNRLICSIGDNSNPLTDKKIDLVSWVPPDDWHKRILKEPVWDGIAITTDNFISENSENHVSDPQYIATQIKTLVESIRAKYQWKLPEDIPLSVYILACIKNRSPLPPEFWRILVFPQEEKSANKTQESPRVSF